MSNNSRTTLAMLDSAAPTEDLRRAVEYVLIELQWPMLVEKSDERERADATKDIRNCPVKVSMTNRREIH